MNTYLNLKIRVVQCTSEILKFVFNTNFQHTQYLFGLVWAGDNSKWILCSRKTGVKCAC